MKRNVLLGVIPLAILAAGSLIAVSGGIFFPPSSRQMVIFPSILQMAGVVLIVIELFFLSGLLFLAIAAREQFLGGAFLKFYSGYDTILASFLFSIAFLFIYVLLARSIHIEWQLDKFLLPGILLGLGILCLLSRRCMFSLPSIDVHQGIVLIGSAALVISMMIAFHAYLAFNQFSDDEQEAVQFVLSLRSHAFPYWDLENGYWGFYHSFMLFSYPMYGLIVFLGETEFVFRLLYFVGLYISLIASIALLELLCGRQIKPYEFVTLLLGAGLVSIIGAFFSSWHPYIAGLGEPSGVDFFGFSLFLCAIYFLFTRRDILFLGFSIAQFAALPSGLPYTITLLGLMFAFTSERRRLAKLAFLYVALVFGYYFAYSIGYPGENKWTIAHFGERYFGHIADVNSSTKLLLSIILLSGGTIFFTLLILSRSRNLPAKVLGAFSLLHVVIGLAFSGLQHIHYYLPLLILLYALGMFGTTLLNNKIQMGTILCVQVTLLFSIWYSFPSQLAVLDNARTIGSLTDVQCQDVDLETLYNDANGFTKVISWQTHGVSLHNWIYYSLKQERKADSQLIIIDRLKPIPPGFTELSSGRNCHLGIRHDFDRKRYLPSHSYRVERAWNLLGVRSWVDHFKGVSDQLCPK